MVAQKHGYRRPLILLNLRGDSTIGEGNRVFTAWRACPQQKRFPIELAGVEFQQKKYPEAAGWIEKALRLDPHDEYADDFAGTVFLMIGNMDAALMYWNRIQKPQIDALKIDPQIHVQRLWSGRLYFHHRR
jgi:tetratricopeptide (TPR) repeat protein